MFNQLQLCFHLVHAIEVDFCVTTANCLCPESAFTPDNYRLSLR